MKKITILFLLTLSLGSNAQITITTADIASPGKVTYQANDTMPVISVGPTGTNQIWNFSGILNAHSIDTLQFIQPADATELYAFPTANLVIPVNKEADVLYAINDVSALTVLGTTENKILFPGGEKTTIVKTNTPIETILQFPTTYSSSFTENYVNFTQYFFGSVPFYKPLNSGIKNYISSDESIHKCGMSDSLREKKIIFKTVVADAWGSITTAAGTFDALRIKETKLTIDTIEAHDALLYVWFFHKATKDSIVKYYWYANNMGVPLVTATMDSTGNVKNVVWLAAPLGTTGINDIASSSDINVFPNPAQDQITFNLDASKVNSIIIYDITGRLIESSPISSDHITINTSDYPDGIYFYSFFDKKKNAVNRGKFSVIR